MVVNMFRRLKEDFLLPYQIGEHALASAVCPSDIERRKCYQVSCKRSSERTDVQIFDGLDANEKPLYLSSQLC